MKTWLLITVLLSSINTVVFGSGEPGMAIRKQKEPGIFTLIYKAEKKTNVLMIISNQEGILVFHEEILNTEGFIRTLNFKTVLPGEYSIDVIELGGNKETQKFDLEMPPPEPELVV